MVDQETIQAAINLYRDRTISTYTPRAYIIPQRAGFRGSSDSKEPYIFLVNGDFSIC